MNYRLCKTLFIAIIAGISLVSAFPQVSDTQQRSENTQSFPPASLKLIHYVNPLIGTDRMGHTYPGATVPFGMVQLSPDTDTIPYETGGKYNPDVYKYCAGYQYSDSTIVGFSGTSFQWYRTL